MGYSLGARMTAWLALRQPQRLRSAIFGGIGMGLIEGGGPGENVADGAGGGFARRGDRSGGADVSRVRRPDPLRSPRARRLPARFAAADDEGGSRRHRRAGADRGRHARTKSRAPPQALGKIIPGAQVLDIPNRDHMRAVGDKVYKTGVLEFLSARK